MSAVTKLAEPLRPFATAHGAICALALDHRDALRNAYARAGLPAPDEQTMLDVKVRVVEELGAAASALLLDELALERIRPQGVGVFMPLEEQGHSLQEGGRETLLLEGFGPAQAAALGARGCKLLLYYRGEHRPTAERQFELACDAAERCHAHGLALVVEPKVYRLDGEPAEDFADRFGELVVAAAAALARSGADLLKLQFPGDAATCREVHTAAGGVPWTLLGGAAVGGPAFAEQLRVACAAGARGFIAGRPIWGGALALAPDEQRGWLREQARPLLEALVEIADLHARGDVVV
jgi:tagatose-1,6-bisphosphate aldolase